jgi:hypothetical protein
LKNKKTIKETFAQRKLQEANQLFNHFLETGEVKPFSEPPSKLLICERAKVSLGPTHQIVRKLSFKKNPKRKYKF